MRDLGKEKLANPLIRRDYRPSLGSAKAFRNSWFHGFSCRFCQFILIGNGMPECSRYFRIFYPSGTNFARIGQRNLAPVLQRLHSTSSQPSPPFNCVIVGDACAGSA